MTENQKAKDNIVSHSIVLNGKGGGTITESEKPVTTKKGSVGIWHNLDYKSLQTISMLASDYKLDQYTVDALTENSVRPRFFTHNGGMVVILRAINSNKGHSFTDMISLRIWVDAGKIITLSHRNIKAVNTVLNSFVSNSGPKTTFECLIDIIANISNDISEVVGMIEQKSDYIEEDAINIEKVKNPRLRNIISAYRRKILSIRRHILPIKDLLLAMHSDKTNFLDASNKLKLRESYNNITKSIEDLDYARDRLIVSFEELNGKINVKISKIMYMISIMTLIFMPLGLITSLLGINVAGIPYAGHPNAFAVVCAILVVVCLGLLAFMKKIKWI